MAFAGDWRAHEGYIIEDEAIKQGRLSSELVQEYNDAVSAVKTASYKDAAEILYVEHNTAIDNMHNAIDTLVDATSTLTTVFVVADMAAEANTTQEQNELKDFVTVNDVSLTDDKVDTFNTAISEVETFAQQAGAFLSAANNTELTSAIDSYAASNGVAVSSYTSVSYTQNIDQYVINFSNGFFVASGYNSNFVTAEEIYEEASIYMEGYNP